MRGANLLDLAVYAIWLRRWFPADAKFVASNEDMTINIAITSATTMEGVVLRMTRLRLPSAIVSDFGEPPLDLVPKAEVDELIRWVRKEVGTKGQAGEQEGIEDTWAEEDEERWIAILWRDEPPWNDLKDPLELMPEEEVNAVVRQMLEDEARRGM